MRQGWCIGLRLPVQLRANNHKDNLKYFYAVLFGKEAKFMNEYKYEDIQSVELLLKHRYENYGTPIARD